MINIEVFGQLEDITGSSVISVSRVTDTELLLDALFTRYPLMKEIKILVAVDQQIIHGKTGIGDHTRIALLPPFSGG